MTDPDQSYKRSWLAIGLGTFFLMISYGSFIVAIAASRSDAPEAEGPPFALAFAFVPIVYVTVAFVSGRRHAPMAVLKAMGLWLLTALPLMLFNPVFGLCVGFGLGGLLTLKESETDRWQARLIAVLLVAFYSLMMLPILPALGVLSGGLLPLASLGLADYYTKHRASTAQ